MAAEAASAPDSRSKDVIVLFDVDGTLTVPRKPADEATLAFLKTLRQKVYIGMVGGSDLVKQREQLGDDVLDLFDYTFPENGLQAFKDGQPIGSTSFRDFLGEDKLKTFLNAVLLYLATEVDCPVKRGTFVEFRAGMLNISPIGRNCSREERNAFEEYDAEHKVRAKMVAFLQEKFGEEYGLQFSIGGQISFDVFPKGWDKTYCLRFLDSEFKTIHFFGDKTFEGGNDYEIFSSERTEGHTVTCPEDTVKICTELFLQ